MLSLLVVLVLLIIAAISLDIGRTIYHLYRRTGEPIFIHISIMVTFIFLTFLSGAIGLFLELDQTTHPLFQFNIVAISLTYLGTGMIYKSIYANKQPILSEYLLFVLFIAPSYAFIAVAMQEFNPVIAVVTQLISLSLLFYMDISIRYQIQQISLDKDNIQDKQVVMGLKSIFNFSMIIHGFGILLMLTFAILISIDYDVEQKQFWIGKWDLFDYIYFLGLIIIAGVFVLINRKTRNFAGVTEKSEVEYIFNSLMA